MSDYFDSPAIGSSQLAGVIEGTYKDENGIDRPRLCFDRATIPVKPSAAMEAGKMFEDLVEETYSDSEKFSEKYFKSNLADFPAGIIEILEAEDMAAAIEACVADKKHYKKDGELRKDATRKFHCLDQIKAHDYRRPVPAPMWDKLQIMLERFKAYPFRIGGEVRTIDEWLTGGSIGCQFQVEHFWIRAISTGDADNDIGGAECRAKFDMVWLFYSGGEPYALCFDLKATENWQSSLGFWRNKYIWQSLHYNKGFKSWCAANGYIPADNVWYIIQESAEPQITHARILSDREYDALTPAYSEAIEKTWQWIEAGKPVAGFIEQETVDRYGKPKQ